MCSGHPFHPGPGHILQSCTFLPFKRKEVHYGHVDYDTLLQQHPLISTHHWSLLHPINCLLLKLLLPAGTKRCTMDTSIMTL